MPLAVTHVLTSVFCADFYRDFITKHKKYIPLHTVFLAGLGGLLPDIDIAITFLFSLFGKPVPLLLAHGGITHTPFFALLFIIPGIIFWKFHKHKKALQWIVIGAGVLLHLFLDFFLGGGSSSGLMLLYPFSHAGFKVYLLASIPNAIAALDAIVLVAWLVYMDRKHKIKDFI